MFPVRLKQLREAAGLSQAELGAKLKITQQTINNYEKGKRDPGQAMIQSIADLFNVSIDYLYGRTDNPTPPQLKLEKNGEPNFDLAFQEKNLGDAVSRIIAICAEFRLPKDVMFKMFEKAVEKYGLPGGDDTAACLDEEGGIAAHGPDYPGSGILDGDESR